MRRKARGRSVTKSTEKDSGPKWCICRTADINRFMIACDNCEEWYHGDCINVTEKQAKIIKTFYCHLCRRKDSSLEIVYKGTKGQQSHQQQQLQRGRGKRNRSPVNDGNSLNDNHTDVKRRKNQASLIESSSGSGTQRCHYRRGGRSGSSSSREPASLSRPDTSSRRRMVSKPQRPTPNPARGRRKNNSLMTDRVPDADSGSPGMVNRNMDVLAQVHQSQDGDEDADEEIDDEATDDEVETQGFKPTEEDDLMPEDEDDEGLVGHDPSPSGVRYDPYMRIDEQFDDDGGVTDEEDMMMGPSGELDDVGWQHTSALQLGPSHRESGGRVRMAAPVCGKCDNCLRTDDCGLCTFCKDMPKFGGPNQMHQRCRLRQCNNLEMVNRRHQPPVTSVPAKMRNSIHDETAPQHLNPYRHARARNNMEYDDFDDMPSLGKRPGDMTDPRNMRGGHRYRDTMDSVGGRIPNSGRMGVYRSGRNFPGRSGARSSPMYGHGPRSSHGTGHHGSLGPSSSTRNLSVMGSTTNSLRPANVYSDSDDDGDMELADMEHCMGPGCMNPVRTGVRYCSAECESKISGRNNSYRLASNQVKYQKEQDLVPYALSYPDHMYCKHHRHHNWHQSNNVNSNLNSGASGGVIAPTAGLLESYSTVGNSALVDNGTGGIGSVATCRGVVPVVTTVDAGGVVQSTVMRMNLPLSRGDGSHELSHATHLPSHQLAAAVSQQQQQQRRQQTSTGAVHDNSCSAPAPSLTHDPYPHPHSAGTHHSHSHYLNDPVPSGAGVVSSTVAGTSGGVTSSDEYYQLNETDNLEINWPQESITSVTG